jgi:serralysin
VVAGLGLLPNRSSDFVLARYNADGSLDASFDGDGRVITDFGFADSAYALSIQSDGKIIAAGNARSSLSRDSNEFGVARYNSDGSLDASFDGDGRVLTAVTPLTDVAVDAVVQPDGKIVVGGYANFSFEPPHQPDYALARYNADGSLDAGFDGDGKVTTTPATYAEDVALQPDGKILLAGRQVVRYNRDGSLDSSFGERAKVVTDGMLVRAVLVQPDAKIIAVGETANDFAVMRLDSKGNVDHSFGGGRVVTDMGPGTDDFPGAAALQTDRRIVVAGSAAVRGQPSNFAVARYLNPAPLQCVVPNVRGKTLRIARRTVARGRCAVGRVMRRFSKRMKKGRVISQSRRPGLRLPVGSRVNLVLSKGRPRSR